MGRNLVLADSQVVGKFALGQAPLYAHNLNSGCPNLDLHRASFRLIPQELGPRFA